ncbi:MAG: hypothetical protein RBR52_11720 [Thiomonas sp.]|uniref:hypothetical protein n=1 Tax=Thiomonas sp. TaxID=2047785 RepID=UPI002A3656C4|nr:hypothetical protein [Thiomonas sp.]MDY0331146.1 hypothetical protein [Thiomonas sp.]
MQPAIDLQPDVNGNYGPYGGQYLPPHLKAIMDDIGRAYLSIRDTQAYRSELNDLYTHYVGRPSPIYLAKRLSAHCGGARIWFKREDLRQ